MNTIGERIRVSREKAGLTQKQLSELSNVSLPSIRAYEQGTRKPKQETLEKLSNPLGVHALFLSGISTDPEGLEILSKILEVDHKELKKLYSSIKRENPKLSVEELTHKTLKSYERQMIYAAGDDFVRMFLHISEFSRDTFKFLDKFMQKAGNRNTPEAKSVVNEINQLDEITQSLLNLLSATALSVKKFNDNY